MGKCNEDDKSTPQDAHIEFLQTPSAARAVAMNSGRSLFDGGDAPLDEALSRPQRTRVSALRHAPSS